ncbi:rRNA-binding ribosome biosynthesis protein utp25 [Coemansia sp. RSA 988]|nr:rRNA-binding ribosome biosynthesis protein utp25 [Coemansia sp. RSA 988]
MPRAKKSKLSRKELQHLKEYGELDPLSSVNDDKDLDNLISNALSRSGYGKFTGKLRSGKNSRDDSRYTKGQPKQKKPSNARVDAYTRLLKSFGDASGRLSSMDAIVSDDEALENSEDMEVMGNINDTQNNNENVVNGATAGTKSDEEMQDNSESDSEEEHEVDAVDSNDQKSDGDDNATTTIAENTNDVPNEVCEANDYMESHYADEDSELAHKKLAAVTNKEYEHSTSEDAALGMCVVYNVAGEKLKPVNPRPLKQRLVKPFHKLNKDHTEFTKFQQGIFNWFDQYRDVVYGGRTQDNEDELTTAYATHVMNHVAKAKDREHKNNAKLAKAHAAGTDIGELRDRGFTRPRVLIILPFRNSAYKLIRKLLTLASAEQEMNSARFMKEYGPDEDEEQRHSANTRKPDDFQQTFAGNIDDAFRIGLQLHHKSVKLYADFYRADIIVASPIGLRMTTGAESGDRKDFDFLSSIETVIVDQCDVLLMQNWDHLVHVFEHMNLTPKKDHGCDFSRVRSWCLDGMARYRRQTIMLSEYVTPDIQSIFNSHCCSIEGKVRIKPSYAGAISDVVAQVTQVLKWVPVKRLQSAVDDRFNHFKDQILPGLQKTTMSDNHTVIFVSSYFDFVRIRNYCKGKDCSFAAISEYSTKTEAMQARRRLYDGSLQFILYSERAHFYHRYPIKGIRHMVFYSLPDRPRYYSELVNLMLTSNDESVSPEQLSCVTFYTKYDQLKIERIAGTKLAPQLLSGERSQFTFA